MAADEARNERIDRTFEHLTRRAGLADHAVLHHHHQIRHRHRLILAVRDVDEGDLEFALQPLQFLAHLDAQERIERGQRLIQQQNFRMRDQRPRQSHALLLAAGQLRGQPQRIVRHMHQLQEIARPFMPLGLRHAAHLQTERHVVEAIQMREQSIALEHHRGAARHRRQIGHVLSVDQNVAIGDRLVARRSSATSSSCRSHWAPAGSNSSRAECATKRYRRPACRHSAW